MTRRRAKGDWVYRGDMHDSAGGLQDAFGTYCPGAGYSLFAGLAEKAAHILYDSSNYRAYAAASGLPVIMPGFHRAEGKRPLMLRVQGWTSLTPSTWAVGSFYFFSMAIMIAEQNATTGNIQLDPGWSMWSYNVVDTLCAARYMNDPKVLNVRRLVQHFNDNSLRVNINTNVKLRRRLDANQCLALVTETSDGSTGVTVVHALRTFVVDEG